MNELQTLTNQAMGVMFPAAEVAYRAERIRRDFNRTGRRRRSWRGVRAGTGDAG